MVVFKGLRAQKIAAERLRELEKRKRQRRRANEDGYIELNNRRVKLARRVTYLKPNPKVGEAPRRRYQRYMRATTIKEALRCGSTVGDIKYDIGKGFLRFPKAGRVEQAELPSGARRPPKGTSLGKHNAYVASLGGTQCWVPKAQKVLFAPNPKAVGCAAHTRYAKYERAKTMQQAMQMGAVVGDIGHDYKHGFLSFPGGLVAEPLPEVVVLKSDHDHVRKSHVKWRARAKQLLNRGRAAARGLLEKVQQTVEAARLEAKKKRGEKRKFLSAPSNFVVVIPSYPHDKRLKILQSHTLAFLRRQRVPLHQIHLVVASKAEDSLYRRSLGSQAPRIHIACPGVVEVRKWIVKHFCEGSHILSIDDDVKDVMCKQKGSDKVLSLRPGGLERLVARAEQMMEAEGANIWALHCGKQVRNMRHKVSRMLGLANGNFYGFRNRPSQSNLLPCLGSAAEDCERSLRFFVQDGVMLRFLGYYADSVPFNNSGGLQTQFASSVERKEKENEHLEQLQKAFPGLIQLQVKGSLQTLNVKFARIGQGPLEA